MRQYYPQLVDDALMVATELVRVSVLVLEIKNVINQKEQYITNLEKDY